MQRSRLDPQGVGVLGATAKVAQGGSGEPVPTDLDRTEGDVDRNLAPVGMARSEREAQSHGPRAGVPEVLGPERPVPRIPLRNEDLQRPSPKRAGLVPEELLAGRVRQHDPAVRIHHDDRVGRGLEQHTRQLGGIDFRGHDELSARRYHARGRQGSSS